MRPFRWIIRTVLKTVHKAVSEEMDELVSKKELKEAQDAIEWMRCMIAPSCFHHPPTHRDMKYYRYCSECPLSDITHDKEAQIIAPPRRISTAICARKRRRYGK